MAEAGGSDPAFDLLPVGIATLDASARWIGWNAKLGDWLQLRGTARTGSPIDPLLTPASRFVLHTHLLPRLHLCGQVHDLPLEFDLPGGPQRFDVHAASCGTAGDGRIRLVLLPSGERQRLDSELARVQRAADAAPAVLFEYTTSPSGRGRFEYLSAGVRGFYGCSPRDLDDDGYLWGRVHPDDREGLLAARDESASTLRPWVWRYRGRCHEAAAWRWHKLQARPQRGADGSVLWHGTIVDVTLQQDMEEAARAREAAEEANRAKSEFLSRMSHELRTPLNAIIGFTQLLQLDRTEPLGPAQQRHVQLVAASAQRLLALINEVLDISRIEAGRLALQLEPLDVSGVLQQAVAQIGPMAAQSTLDVDLRVSPGLWVVADALRLGQVMANLLSNAVKYNRPGGRVVVSASREAARCVISVRDTGPGMTGAQVYQLFQPFNRLGAERHGVEGTGLGLVITRHLVQAMGGHLEVRSEPGEGAEFSVRLPVAPGPGADGPSPEAGHEPGRSLPVTEPPAPLPVRDLRVLCVEDDPVNALLMTGIFAQVGVAPLRVAGSGAEALSVLGEWVPDLLLLDLHLGDMDGATLLQRIRSLPGLARVPAIAVSADAMPEHVDATLSQGFQDYWTKPLDVQRVALALRRTLALPAR